MAAKGSDEPPAKSLQRVSPGKDPDKYYAPFHVWKESAVAPFLTWRKLMIYRGMFLIRLKEIGINSSMFCFVLYFFYMIGEYK